MAGLWERWEQDQQSLYSCTILTQPSSGLLEPLHHRMPLFVDRSQAEQWLNDGIPAFDTIIDNQLTGDLDFYPVGKEVNSGRAAGPQLIAPIPDS